MKAWNRNQIKYIAILAMLIDHIAWAFVPLNTVGGQCMHMIGRITGPIMAYFIAEGYHYTKKLSKYIARLGCFALLSWMPFVYFLYGKMPFYREESVWKVIPQFGMIYTLLLGLIAICIYEQKEWSQVIRAGAIFFIIFLSGAGDWAYIGVLLCLLFHIGRNRSHMWQTYCLYSFLFIILQMIENKSVLQLLYLVGIFIVPFLLRNYHGDGGSRKKFHKWFFYLFYPGHLLILGLLRWIVI